MQLMQIKCLVVLLSLWLVGLLAGIPMAEAAPELDAGLVKSVAKLKIGYHGYIIGQPLTDQQRDLAQQNLEKDAYRGTYKFKDDEDTHVVVAQGGDVVLAIYRDAGASSVDELSELLAQLMDNFGEPTAMAHDKIIYWVYGSAGKISEEAFNLAKNSGVLDALVTVKFNSSEEFQAVRTGEKESTDVYFLLSSQPILQSFFADGSE